MCGEECYMNTDKLKIVEHKSASYAPRTYYNAHSADVTIAVACDFSTAGERLTKKAAGEYYLHFQLNWQPVECARSLYRYMKNYNLKTINIAGNGIYTWNKHGYDQHKVNYWLLNLLTPVHQHLGIDYIYSGGQSGTDLAGGVVSCLLDIPCTMTLPKGYKMRFEDGKDIDHSQDEVYSMVEDCLKRWDI